MSTRFKDFTDEELGLLLEVCKEHWFNLEIDAIKNLGEHLSLTSVWVQPHHDALRESGSNARRAGKFKKCCAR
jgi:hypothetical protein